MNWRLTTLSVTTSITHRYAHTHMCTHVHIRVIIRNTKLIRLIFKIMSLNWWIILHIFIFFFGAPFLPAIQHKCVPSILQKLEHFSSNYLEIESNTCSYHTILLNVCFSQLLWLTFLHSLTRQVIKCYVFASNWARDEDVFKRKGTIFLTN